MDKVAVALELLRLVLMLIGHEKASDLLRQEAVNQANRAANAIEVARDLK